MLLLLGSSIVEDSDFGADDDFPLGGIDGHDDED